VLTTRNFLVFINPISGTRNKKEIRSYIQSKLTNLQYSYEILSANKHGKYSFLKEKIITEKVTDIIICGGDGTVNQITSYLINTNIKVGIIPLGSGNGLAFTAGIPKDYKKALEVILNGNAGFIDALVINKNYSCHLCGLGFDAQVSHDFARQEKRGPLTYIKETLKNFFKAKPYRFEVSANGNTFITNAFFLSIANSNQFGNSIVIAPKASLSDGLLDIVIVQKAGKFGLVFKLLKQIRSGKITSIRNTDKTIHYFQTKKMSIKNLDNAPFHIDGEPMETAATFDVEIIERAFLLLQPGSL
jgi:YegS/Rv2252/BmrU family lipid kinase